MLRPDIFSPLFLDGADAKKSLCFFISKATREPLPSITFAPSASIKFSISPNFSDAAVGTANIESRVF